MKQTSLATVPNGVYLITPDWSDTARLLAAVAGAMRGGVAAVQYRNKAASAGLRREQAGELQRLVHAAGLPFFVDDDAELAMAVGADGVHVGRDDGDPAAARAKLPPSMTLGVSCYADLERVARAMRAGANYVALGAMSASRTKPGAAIAPIECLAEAKQLGAHVVASGGITIENVARIAARGAHAVGVVSAVFAAADPQRAAARLVAAFAMGPSRA
jgi:thiamine-phosphate pyrophosphorylase